MTIRLKFHLDKVFTPAFESSLDWAVNSGLLTEEEATQVMADAIVDTLTVEEHA